LVTISSLFVTIRCYAKQRGGNRNPDSQKHGILHKEIVELIRSASFVSRHTCAENERRKAHEYRGYRNNFHGRSYSRISDGNCPVPSNNYAIGTLSAN